MPYQNYNFPVQLAAMSPWYTVSNIMQTLDVLGNTDFSVNTSRAQSKTLWTSMMKVRPFGPDQRFDDSTMYICATDPQWSKLFTQLVEALGYSPDTKDNRSGGRLEVNNSYNDSYHSFWKARETIMTNLSNPINLTTRETFETKYNLTWIDFINPPQLGSPVHQPVVQQDNNNNINFEANQLQMMNDNILNVLNQIRDVNTRLVRVERELPDTESQENQSQQQQQHQA